MAKKLTQEEKINQMFDANLASQKETLKQDYAKADADYVRQQEQAQKVTDANLARTAVEAQKEAVNNAEINNAAGLSSGAKAQLRLSNENQMRSDMTALRVQQQETNAAIERARSTLSQESASAIRKAQQDNDLAKAEALYAEAEKQDELLRQKQEKAEEEKKANELTAAQLLANTGDYSRLGKFYGLTEAEVAALAAGASKTATYNTLEVGSDAYKTIVAEIEATTSLSALKQLVKKYVDLGYSEAHISALTQGKYDELMSAPAGNVGNIGLTK